MRELFTVFKPFPELIARFSSRIDGDMKLKDATAESLLNRECYLKKEGVDPATVVGVLACHGADVIRVGKREAGAGMRRVDGLFTDESGVLLSVTAGDCLAVYLYDPQSRTVALLHAGWRGLARGILSKALRQFSHPERIRVAITPFIQSCHFEVGSEVVDMFAAHPEALIERDGRSFLDLGIIAWRQLLEAGIKSEYTEISDQCTACQKELYFSYRRDKPVIPEVMIAVLGLLKS